VPKLLTEEQIERRVEVELKFLTTRVKSIITGDETWVYGYDPETKVQKNANSTRPKKCRHVRSNIEATRVVFFDCFGLAHYEYCIYGPDGKSSVL